MARRDVIPAPVRGADEAASEGGHGAVGRHREDDDGAGLGRGVEPSQAWIERQDVDLGEEIRRIQAEPAASAQRSGFLMQLSPFVPRSLRRLFFRALRRDPHWLKRTAGTTLVTAIGLFGIGAGWAVGIVPLHTLCLSVGGITRKPGLVDGRVDPREYLALTASIDHDIVDGAPAARFARRLREIIEGAQVLRDISP